jgi:hypothetical protein
MAIRASLAVAPHRVPDLLLAHSAQNDVPILVGMSARGGVRVLIARVDGPNEYKKAHSCASLCAQPRQAYAVFMGSQGGDDVPRAGAGARAYLRGYRAGANDQHVPSPEVLDAID